MSLVAQKAEMPLGCLEPIGYQRLSTGKELVR
jgi:hypothetical protein